MFGGTDSHVPGVKLSLYSKCIQHFDRMWILRLDWLLQSGKLNKDTGLKGPSNLWRSWRCALIQPNKSSGICLVSKQMVAKFYHPYVVVTVNLTWQIFQAYITRYLLVEKLHTLIKLCLALNTLTPWFIFEAKLLAKYILRKWEEGTCWVWLIYNPVKNWGTAYPK